MVILLIATAMRLIWTLFFRLIFKVLYKTAQKQSFSFPEEFIFVIKRCHKLLSQSCHVYMAPCRSSSLCSLCFLLSLSFLNSSYSGLSVGSSSRQRGHELVFPNQGRIHPEWNRCLQGISRTVSCSSNSSKQTGHFRPLSACSGEMTTTVRV